MKQLVFIIIANFIIQVGNSQELENNSFTTGESLRFVASYNMSSLWTELAEISMEVSSVKTSSQELYRLKCTASTYEAWDSYFKIRDLYESYVDKVSIKPFLFKRSIDEGGYKKNIKYIYKWKSGKVNVTTKRKTNPEKKFQIDVTNQTYDLVSVLYMIRNINFSSKKVGDIVKIKVLIDAKEEIVTIKYRGIETINVSNYGKKKCHKLSVALKDDKILKGKDRNNIWLTADNNMVPVLIKAQIPVGSAQIKLIEMSGLRN